LPFASSEPPPKEENWPSWAPDGQRLVYECYLDGPIDSPSILAQLNGIASMSFYTLDAADLCITDVGKHDQVRLTSDAGGDWHPVWSPDGSQIAYLREDGIYVITLEGQNRRQLVPVDSTGLKLVWRSKSMGIVTWSPEGDRLLFSGCLEHQDHDVYVVDVDTGAMTNLTLNSRAHDFAPAWTLGGSQIVFLSTDSSSPYVCSPEEDALPQMKVVNADGSGERVVYAPEFYYPYWQVSVSNSGQIAFVTNMTSRTYAEYYDRSAEHGDLYSISLVEGTLVQILAAVDDWGLIVLPVWSPDERYVAYRGSLSDLKTLDVGTGEVRESLERLSIARRFVWSPDSQRIAVVASTRADMARDSEEHIHVFDLQSQTFQPLIQSSP
jgi:Tol biopolymer transport system component